MHSRGKKRFQGPKRAVRGIVCLNGWAGVIATRGFVGGETCGLAGLVVRGLMGMELVRVGADGEWDELVNAGE